MEILSINWQSFILVGTAFVIGLVALWGLFDTRTKQRRKELDEQEDRLITLLKEEISQLKKSQEEGEIRVREMSEKYTKELRDLRDKIIKVNGENEILKALLEGRDKTSLEFQKQGFEAIKRTERMEKTITIGFKTMNANIERLAKAIEKHLQTQEAIITNK